MRIVIRVDGGALIGGGHIVRCLTLAEGARGRGHDVVFVCMKDAMTSYLTRKSFEVVEIMPQDFVPETSPTHVAWLRLPWDIDAARTAEIVLGCRADWLIWDHYGLDARWVGAIQKHTAVKTLAIDDLDDRALGADLVLDQTRLNGSRTYAGSPAMIGPSFALLRPEFAQTREAALARMNGPVRRIIVTPGLMDAAGLALLALDALEDWDGEVEVVMGHASQSRAAVEQRVAGRTGWYLTLDAPDMPERLAVADLCIGAAGMSTWERCCLGLPTVVVGVAANQMPLCQAIDERGAAICLPLDDARSVQRLKAAVDAAIDQTEDMARAAAQLCDGKGTERVLDCLEANLRPLTRDDTRHIFDWRSSPHVQNASLTQTHFSFDSHLAWMNQVLNRTDGLWRIYEEGLPIGFVSAVDHGSGVWLWNFYLGARETHKGAGGRMLAWFLQEIWRDTACERIKAVVLTGNAASQALHLKLGFRQIDNADKGHLLYVLDRPDNN
jgi:UDP-2,4-diacetamido-2,4,6-trideoxy-beta-L-altropyranose hydrolase